MTHAEAIAAGVVVTEYACNRCIACYLHVELMPPGDVPDGPPPMPYCDCGGQIVRVETVLNG